MNPHDLETEGNEVSSGFQDKDAAVRLWLAITEGIDDKVLADECEISRGYYSKVASGQQGDLLGLVYLVGRTRPKLRHEFIVRLAEMEAADPITQAAEQLTAAAIRFLRLRGEMPAKADRMARSVMPVAPRKAIA